MRTSPKKIYKSLLNEKNIYYKVTELLSCSQCIVKLYTKLFPFNLKKGERPTRLFKDKKR